LHPKAAWRFASRRSPKSVVAAQAALQCYLMTSVLSERFFRSAEFIPLPRPQVLQR